MSMKSCQQLLNFVEIMARKNVQKCNIIAEFTYSDVTANSYSGGFASQMTAPENDFFYRIISDT